MSPDGGLQPPEEHEDRRLDRELNELLQELRVAQGGILLLVGFLLVIPFTSRFETVTTFQRDIYYLTLLSAGTAAIVVVAPVSHHRLVFRLHDKQALVTRGNLMVIASLALLAFTVLGVLVLVTDFLFSGLLAAVMSVVYVALVLTLWYLLPLHSRRRAVRAARDPNLASDGDRDKAAAGLRP